MRNSVRNPVKFSVKAAIAGFSVVFLAGCSASSHVHEATHLTSDNTAGDSRGTETGVSDCYLVESYDYKESGFFWLKTEKINYFADTYCRTSAK